MNDPVGIEHANAEAAKRIAELEAENERLTKGGVCEVAASNQSVMEYMAHWEKRAEKAEAENERLRYVLGGVRRAIQTGRNEPLVIWKEQIDIAIGPEKGGE